MNAVTLKKAIAAAIVLSLPALLAADPLVFDDGGDHVIDYVVQNDSVVIRNGSRVTVGAGGVTPAIELLGGQLTLAGGSIAELTQGAPSPTTGNSFHMLSGEVRGGIDKWEGSAEILGGRIVGNVRVIFDGIRVAGDPQIGGISGLGAPDGGTGSVRIEGGRIGTVRFSRDSFAQVEFLGGTIESLRISADDGGTLEMRGGMICCGLVSPAVAQIFAGSIGTLLETEHLTLYDGELMRGISLQMTVSEPRATIFGGFVSGPDFALRAFDTSILDIHGGMFDGAFLGYDDAIFNVFGRGLEFDGSMLTGFLADGTPIDVPVQLNSDRAAIRLFAVPEPAAWALLLVGLAGLSLTTNRSEVRS